MEAIKDTVIKVIEDLSQQKSKAGGGDPQVWLKKTLTKKELKHIKFNYFKRGVLDIGVDSSSWLYALSLQKETLLTKFNKQSATIKDIRFHLGEIK